MSALRRIRPFPQTCPIVSQESLELYFNDLCLTFPSIYRCAITGGQRHGGTAATAGERVYLQWILINSTRVLPKLYAVRILRNMSLFVRPHSLAFESTSAHRYKMEKRYITSLIWFLAGFEPAETEGTTRMDADKLNRFNTGQWAEEIWWSSPGWVLLSRTEIILLQLKHNLWHFVS